jgi:hypothetical protein
MFIKLLNRNERRRTPGNKGKCEDEEQIKTRKKLKKRKIQIV